MPLSVQDVVLKRDIEIRLPGLAFAALKDRNRNRIYGREPISKPFLDNFYVKLKPLIFGRRAGKSAYEIKVELADVETKKRVLLANRVRNPALLIFTSC